MLRREIGFEAWCWSAVDPASRLPTDAVAYNPAIKGKVERFHKLNYSELPPSPDAPCPAPDGVVRWWGESALNRRDPSPKWQEVLGPAGVGDLLDVYLVAGGARWGHIALYRAADCGMFTAEERSFIAELAPSLTAHHRRSLRIALAQDGLDEIEEPGTLVLDSELRPLAVTPEAQRWLSEIAPARTGSGPAVATHLLPAPVYAVAARAHALAALGETGDRAASRLARVRVFSPTGRWLILRAALLSSAPFSSVPPASIAVTIEPARPSEIAPLLMQAWGLTSREREVASGVLEGLATREIAAELFISHHTVRDHVRAAFDKVGVRSRQQLIEALATGRRDHPAKRS